MSDEVELTSREREVEIALRKLRPAPAHIDPAIAVLAARRVRSRRFQIAAAISTIAAGGIAWIAVRQSGRMPEHAMTPLTVKESYGDGNNTSSVEAPMLVVYRQALAKAPAELESLLNRQAIGGSASGGQVIRVRVLRLHRDNLQSLPGEI